MSASLSKKHFDEIAGCAGSNLDGPAERVARTLALVATAGEVSTILKITGWQNGDALQAVKLVFEHWLSRRQGPIIQVCRKLEKYLKSTMHKLEPLSVGPIIPDRIGYIDDDFLYLSKEVLHQVFEENRLASVKQLLIEQNVMSKQGKHLAVKMPRSVPNRERHYKISRKKLAEFSEPGTED